MRLAEDGRKNYASDLIASGIARNNIYEIAFAFDGKEVLVKERQVTMKYKHGAICRPPYLVGERWRKLLVFLFASNALKV